MDECYLDDSQGQKGSVDIVLLPPVDVDSLSNEKDLNENILEVNVPNDVPGTIQIHAIYILILSKTDKTQLTLCTCLT